MNNYLIHETLKFNPQMHTFEFFNGEPKRISLTTPASLCLNSILEKQGEVVSYDELMQQVWASRGMQVSLNTLYQNISILRRTFERYGLPSTAIQTVSRKGIMFSPFISVQKVSSEPSGSLFQEVPNEQAISSTDNTVNKENIITENVGANDHDYIQTTSPPDIHEGGDKRKFFSTESIFILLPGVTIIALILFFSTTLSERPETQYSFKDYSMTEKEGNCIIMSNKSADKKFVAHTFSDLEIDCHSQKWIYATNYPDTGKVSFLTCQYQFSATEEQFCESYYIEKQK